MRDLISFQCEQCKRKNYTGSRGTRRSTTEEIREQQVLPRVPESHVAQGGKGLTRGRRPLGSVALTGRAPDSKSGGCRFESCLARFARSKFPMAAQGQAKQSSGCGPSLGHLRPGGVGRVEEGSLAHEELRPTPRPYGRAGLGGNRGRALPRGRRLHPLAVAVQLIC